MRFTLIGQIISQFIAHALIYPARIFSLLIKKYQQANQSGFIVKTINSMEGYGMMVEFIDSGLFPIGCIKKNIKSIKCLIRNYYLDFTTMRNTLRTMLLE